MLIFKGWRRINWFRGDFAAILKFPATKFILITAMIVGDCYDRCRAGNNLSYWRSRQSIIL